MKHKPAPDKRPHKKKRAGQLKVYAALAARARREIEMMPYTVSVPGWCKCGLRLSVADVGGVCMFCAEKE